MMTIEEKIKGIERRIASLRDQMTTLLSMATSDTQKRAVEDSHKMTIEEMYERIEALKRGENDPCE